VFDTNILGKVVGEVLIHVVLLREGHLRACAQGWLFPNFRRTHVYENLPLRKQLSFYFQASFSFGRKKIFS
jgi:hypothetical protein